LRNFEPNDKYVPYAALPYPMMLRSAASPGSWGRSTGRHANAVPRAVIAGWSTPKFKTPLPDGMRRFFVSA